MKTLLSLGFIASALVAVGVWVWQTPGLRPVIISVYQPPILFVDNRIQNLGNLVTDSHAKTDFFVFNKGGKYLKISKVDASCGCTVVKTSKTLISPGSFSKISINVDTALKLGAMRKQITVSSNDPKRPEVSLFITATVLPKPMASHQSITLSATNRLALFEGQCATCHVNQGHGKTGKQLFLADCSMCHGAMGQGNHAAGPSLLEWDSEKAETKPYLFNRIANGSPHSPQMPPFSKQNGGPLVPDEIDSLVSFLLYQQKQKKEGLLMIEDKSQKEDELSFKEAMQHPN
jgi:mono/diheme cytochrome c family protein